MQTKINPGVNVVHGLLGFDSLHWFEVVQVGYPWQGAESGKMLQLKPKVCYFYQSHNNVITITT